MRKIIKGSKSIIKLFSIIFASLFMMTYAYGFDKKQYEKISKNSFVLVEYLEVLYNQDRNLLLAFFPQVEKKYFMVDEHSEEYIEYTWTDLPCEYQINFSIDEDYRDNSKNVIYELAIGDFDTVRFEICEMKLLENKIVFFVKNLTNDKTLPLIDIPKIIPNELYHILLVFDGDYVDLYIDDVFIHKFCHVNHETIEQYENLINSNICNLSKVTWPRNADGTSEYDNKIIIPEQIVLFENEKTNNTSLESSLKKEKIITEEVQDAELRTVMVKKNTEMVIVENSILRLDPDPNGAYMDSVVKETKVKVLELGKAETIDGINSNWVKVEVQGGAKDRDGKEIKKGTVGWCYGGYLK